MDEFWVCPQAEAFLEIEFDFTLLVTATPPRRATSRQVILAVGGNLDLDEIDSLEQIAVMKRKNVERMIFRCQTGRYYEYIGPFDPAAFTDRDGGLPFLKDFRKRVSKSIRSVPPTLRSAYFYPGSKIVDPDDFGRVLPERSGMTEVEMEGVERERAKVKEELAGYAVMDGSLFRGVAEPFLVLSYDSVAGRFFLDVADDIQNWFVGVRSYAPLACFQIDETSQARAYAGRLKGGREKAQFKSGGYRVVSASAEKLEVDTRATTLKALAMRMRAAYKALLEGGNGIVWALTTLPVEEIMAFRKLCSAIDDDSGDTDRIEDAVLACVACEKAVGRKVFTWDAGPIDNFETMLDFWNDRPISIGFP